MLEEDRECTNCTFDTMAIVTVDIDNWEYCPICGSNLRSASDENKEENDHMKEIPIETPGEPNPQTNDSQETPNEDTDDKSGEDKGTDEEQVDEFVEEELERLRDNTENEGK